MHIGLPKEVKPGEGRVALTPQAVALLTADKHAVSVQSGAGEGAGFTDAEYATSGAAIVNAASTCYLADLVVKVKAPTQAEHRLLAPNSILFSFLNLPTERDLAASLIAQRVTTLAFDTVEDRNARLPILAPMSALSGELALMLAAQYLQRAHGGRGVAIRGSRVVILGAGNVGSAAARTALALGADVTVLSNPGPRMAMLAHSLGLNARTIAVSPSALSNALDGADVLIAAINTRGAATSKLVSREHLRAMGEGSVLVDVCIDGGGIAETSRATTLVTPSFVAEGVIHIGVPNLPGAVPRSATRLLSEALLPYVQAIANKGLASALRDDVGLASGLQLFAGQATHRAVAAALGRPWVDPDALLFAC